MTCERDDLRLLRTLIAETPQLGELRAGEPPNLDRHPDGRRVQGRSAHRQSVSVGVIDIIRVADGKFAEVFLYRLGEPTLRPHGQTAMQTPQTPPRPSCLSVSRSQALTS